VLGTGTEVGKTYVTKLITNLLTGRYPLATVLALKPVESGVAELADSDAAILGRCSQPPCEPRHAFALRAPISPHLAAKMEHQTVTTDAITRWVRAQLSAVPSKSHQDAARDTWTIIETAGGVFSPISDTQTSLSIAVAFDPAVWVLVAPDRLGVLHDLRATLIALEKVARLPDLLLLNAPAVPDPSTGTNRREIENLGIAPVTGEIARNSGLNSCDERRLLERIHDSKSQC
jgi:dethiobiotin synthetase